MNVSVFTDQPEVIYNSFVQTQDVVLKTRRIFISHRTILSIDFYDELRAIV